MVVLTKKNYDTLYCEFTYDVWSEDGGKLPTMNTAGKNEVSLIPCCSAGSTAISSDLTTVKVLNGKTNTWG